jgi:octaprenyl-diphosphate synthase
MAASIEERLAAIEAEIRRMLPPAPDADWIRSVVGALPSSAGGALSPEQVRQVIEPGQELLGRGGKRWRPLLAVLICELCGGADRALPLTPLVELPHNGSLIIDDIEDNSPQRRGGRAIHLAYGSDLAINAGNLLYFLPFRLVERSGLDREVQAAVYRCFLEEMARLHFGQGLDILWHRDPRAVPTVEEYLAMCRLKTGSLACLAARIGVLAGGGTPAQEQAAAEAAGNLGIAFQIVDDVANLAGGVPGKRRGDDILEGKKSLPAILFWRRTDRRSAGERERLRELFHLARSAQAARDRPDPVLEPAVEEACRLIASSGSLEESVRIARRLQEEARERFTSRFPAGEARDQLLGLIDGLVPETPNG